MADVARDLPLERETILTADVRKARVARVYAEALLAVAAKQGAAEAVGDELAAFVRDVLDANKDVEAFLASPAVGRKAKAAALDAALAGRASELLRGLLAVLARNGRLDLLRA